MYEGKISGAKSELTMPIRNNHYCVFDFETSGKEPTQCYPIEIAAKIYNSRSLEPIDGASFSSLCRPPKDHKIDVAVYGITGISEKEVAEATPIEIVYPKFVEWLLKYNPEGTKWTALIPCGQNADLFDLVIHRRMMELYCKKTELEKVFNNRPIDLMNISKLWFENTKEIAGYSLSELRKFFGIPTDKQHRGLIDVEHTGWIIMKMMLFHRQLAVKYMPKMKNSYKKQVPCEV